MKVHGLDAAWGCGMTIVGCYVRDIDRKKTSHSIVIIGFIPMIHAEGFDLKYGTCYEAESSQNG